MNQTAVELKRAVTQCGHVRDLVCVGSFNDFVLLRGSCDLFIRKHIPRNHAKPRTKLHKTNLLGRSLPLPVLIGGSLT